MLVLGHIDYSNCFPVHASFLERGAPPGVELRSGIPSVLNAELRAGTLDVAPSSSIEYARNASRYRLLPGFAIGASGPVGSILLELGSPIEMLSGREVAIPTASATSVVLLKILLERRFGVRPRYRWFEQSDAADPVRDGAAGALWIGDVALRRGLRLSASSAPHPVLDLGEAWTEWTGLPFAFAVWQTSAGEEKDEALLGLYDALRESRAYFVEHDEELARRHAPRFGLEPDHLLRYWRSLVYDLDARMQEGLLHFYRLAAELGEAPSVPALRWVTG